LNKDALVDETITQTLSLGPCVRLVFAVHNSNSTMMQEDESHPTVSTKKGATEEMASSSKQHPPSIQLEEANPDHAHVEKRDADHEKSFGQLRTPKHANKTAGSSSRDASSPASPGQRGFSREKGNSNQKITPDRSLAAASQQQQQGYPTQEKAHHEKGRIGGPGQEYYGEGYGQFRGPATQDPNQASYYAARVRMMQQGAPQTISPGGSSLPPAYRTAPGGYSAAAYAMQAGRFQQEQGYHQADFAGYPGQSGQYGYQDPRFGYGDGSRHPQYGQGLAPSYQPGQPHGHYDPRYGANQGNFTRAVSNSFDRSTKGPDNAARSSGAATHGPAGKSDRSPTMRPVYYSQDPSQNMPDASIPDDHSWGQLNQVASVDDSTLARARLAQYEKTNQEKTTPESEKDKELRQPPSTSSSLTNSPTDGHDAVGEGKPNPSPSKLAPLDSLSSVASAQEPMDTAKDGKDSKPSGNGPSSPGSSNESLDLMKCHSGSSGLLHGFPGTHGRSMSGSSFLLDSKRSRDDRLFVETKSADGEGPPSKKSKVSDDKKKSAKREGSPPDGTGLGQHAAAGHSTGMSLQERVSATVGRSSFSPAFMGAGGYPSLDRAPSYTYSIESVPSKEYVYPPLPPRPGSSSSSTIAPPGGGRMQLDGPIASTDAGNRDSLVGALPSWDIIHAQDSFGAGSVGAGGAPIVGNFSFSQDYPMLSASGSNLGNTGSSSHGGTKPAQAQANQQGAQQEGRHHGPPTSLAESRNQSFEGGQYHGSDMGYAGAGGTQSGAAPSQYQKEGYRHTGQFPPQASSWGTATSSTSTQPTHPGTSYQAAQLAQYRNTTRSYPSSRMRNYSEESTARTSPPVGGAAASFQPPSDFVAPRHPQLRRPPPQAVYIMSSDGRKSSDPSIVSKTSAGGVYGWSKEEDDHLTEVMKKFKNPRDWEPIAKEHGYNKTAKECHERWIRYLKPGVRKGQWTDHEDAIVVEAVTLSSEQPFTRWSDLAQKLPGRVGKQIRDRWVNHLNPNINHMPFSKEDVSLECVGLVYH